MTLDEIIAAYREPLPSREALRAGVPLADDLASPVYDLLDRLCAGECLMAPDLNLLNYGLHVLAAARMPGLWPRLVDLARVPQEELEEALARTPEIAVTQMMLSAWDGDTAGLLHLIEHADLSAPGRAAMFDTLARLTFDGRISREVTAAFLGRFEQDALADAEDEAWFDWTLAVTRLGLVELEPALRRAWHKPAFFETDDDYRAERLAELRHAAGDPGDVSVFGSCGVQPITDAGDAVAWLEESLRMLKEAADQAGLPFPPEDEQPVRAASPTVLTSPELHWLGRFLVSRQVPPTAMPLAMLDGFLTAAAIGPGSRQPADLMAAIWGENGEQPDWREGQEQRIADLVARHWHDIRARRSRGELAPLASAEDEHALDAAADWAQGFLIGIELDQKAWEALIRDHRGSEVLAEIEDLTGAENPLLGRVATREECVLIVERLPEILHQIARFWDDPAKGFRRGEPLRVVKIGRNDPCPCGSGKKYKKCCAQTVPPALN